MFLFCKQMHQLLGLGAVLSMIRNGKEMPVAFYARQTRGAERNYSATELEALGVVAAVEHFAHYLCDREFTVYTDHKALYSLLSSRSLNKRFQRMALKLQGWNLRIQYRPGEANGNADALSRQEWTMDGGVSEGQLLVDRSGSQTTEGAPPISNLMEIRLSTDTDGGLVQNRPDQDENLSPASGISAGGVWGHAPHSKKGGANTPQKTA